MLIDTHCHLDFPDFAPEQAEIVARAQARGVGRMITISTHVTKFAAIAAIAERYEDVFCTVGTHPNHALDEPEASPEQLVALARHPKCVGFRRGGARLSLQSRAARTRAARVFRNHIAAARMAGLPLVIHTRDADEVCRGSPGRGNRAWGVSPPCSTLRASAGRSPTRPWSWGLYCLLGRRDLRELTEGSHDVAAALRWSGCWIRD